MPMQGSGSGCSSVELPPYDPPASWAERSSGGASCVQLVHDPNVLAAVEHLRWVVMLCVGGVIFTTAALVLATLVRGG